MIQKLILFLLLILSPSLLYSQLVDVIRTGRPGQSFGAYTVGSRVLQLQGGFTYSNSGNSTLDEENFFDENLIIRYGVKENIEISSLITHSALNFGEKKTSGISRFDLGFRIHLFERSDGFAASWQARAVTNWVSDEYQRDETGVNTAISLMYPALGGGFTANVGLLTLGNGDGASFTYTFNYSRSITDGISIFIEPYGSYSDVWNTYIDAGFGFLINNDLLLDISAGMDVDKDLDFFFIDGGISWRILAFR